MNKLMLLLFSILFSGCAILLQEIVHKYLFSRENFTTKTRQLSNSISLEEYDHIIPEGYVFVMGDNREGSLDSRSKEIGIIPVNNIIGKAEWRIMPFDKFGTVYYNMK